MVLDVKREDLRVLPATEKRCAVVYAPSEVIDQQVGQSVNGAYYPGPVELFGETFPTGCLLLRPPPKSVEASLDADLSKVIWGRDAAHEFAHSNGAFEVDARRAERAYLQKRGLIGPTDLQILKDLQGYKEDPRFKEEIASLTTEVFGPSRSWFGRLTQNIKLAWASDYQVVRDFIRAWMKSGKLEGG